MKRIISTLFGLAVLCLFAEAQAVPATVSFTGRLSTSNGPVTGNVNLVFTLFNQATNGTSMWTETRNNVAANNGLVYVDLGSQTTLDEGVLQNNPLFLEISVGGEILSPRLPLQSVPYSIRSEVANSADTLGTILPGDVVTAVNAGGGITANRTGNTVTLTGTTVAGTAPIAVAGGNVSLTTCGANQVYKMNAGGTAWACLADNDNPPSATAPVNVSANNITLTTCAANQIYKMNAGGTAWACGTDSADVPPTATAPLSVSGVNLSLTTCAANQVYKMNAGGTAWACSADSADVPPTATAPLSVTGVNVSLTTCAANQIYKMNAGGTAWACAADNDVPYTGTAPITVAGTTISLANDGVTAAHIATGAAGIDEVALPIGTFYDSATAVAGANYLYSASTFTPTTNGSCYVTSYSETSESAPSGTAYMYIARREGASNGLYGYSVYYGQEAGSANSASVSYIVPVTAGNAYTFGCYINAATGSSWIGNLFSCYTSYICT